LIVTSQPGGTFSDCWNVPDVLRVTEAMSSVWSARTADVTRQEPRETIDACG
jgi:hypothetical protein